MSYEPRLGFVLMFEGDKRKIHVPIDGVTTFSAVTGKLSEGENNVTATYAAEAADATGNVLTTGLIGGTASIPAGTYRYYLTGTYSTSKVRSWFIDILVEPKDSTVWLASDVWKNDYDPLIREVTMYEGDVLVLDHTFSSDAEFSAVTGVLQMGTDDTPDTDYCTSAASASASTLTSAVIGGGGTIPAGEYIYFITGTYGEQVVTWFWKINVLPRYS